MRWKREGMEKVLQRDLNISHYSIGALKCHRLGIHTGCCPVHVICTQTAPRFIATSHLNVVIFNYMIDCPHKLL